MGTSVRLSEGRLTMPLLLLPLLVALVAATDYFPFSYTNCGGASDPIQVVAPSVTPSPVRTGQNVISGKVTVAKEFSSANAGSLQFKIQKHVGFWVDIPCSAIPHGCSYDNFCLLGTNGTVAPHTCAILKRIGLPCGCPVPAGTYTVNNLSEGPVKIPDGLDFLVDGSFRIHVQLKDSQGNSVLCA